MFNVEDELMWSPLRIEECGRGLVTVGPSSENSGEGSSQGFSRWIKISPPGIGVDRPPDPSIFDIVSPLFRLGYTPTLELVACPFKLMVAVTENTRRPPSRIEEPAFTDDRGVTDVYGGVRGWYLG